MKTMADAALNKADLERIRSEIAEAEGMEGEVRTFLASLAGVRGLLRFLGLVGAGSRGAIESGKGIERVDAR